MSKALDFEQFPKIIIEFKNYKLNIQNCSEKTVNEYLLDLRIFLKYIIAQKEKINIDSEEFMKIDISKVDIDFLKNITTDSIMEFLYYAQKSRSNMWSARARKLSAIKSFFKYLVSKRNYLEINPAINIETPKKSKTLPKFLTLEESLSLLEAVKNDVESASRIRDYCIITLFLNCGMRVSELTGIMLSDIDTELRSIRVTGKGNKQRIVYLNDACRLALGDYLTARLQETTENKIKNARALFLSGKGRNNPISVKTVQWMVKKYLDIAGLGNRGYSVHKLRHTAATLMYQTGKVDVRTLKDILGHEQLNTTQIYTHVSNQSMEQAMSDNPLSGIKPPDVHSLKPLDESKDEN